MKVAIVHDDLVQWGGAERVLEGLCRIFPDAPVYTSVYDTNNQDLKKIFGEKKIITTFLQKIPGWKTLYKALLPFYPIAFEQFNFDGFDLVISHTTRFAKAILTKPETRHICYCHTPPRFLWHLSGTSSWGLLEPLMSKLRLYDTISSKRVDLFLAGSENARRRIKKIYRADSKVIYPFIDLDRFKNCKSFDGGYFLVASRLNKYKRVDLAIRACMKLQVPLKIIGLGPELKSLKRISNNLIEFMGSGSDEDVVKTMSGCRALLICGEEDFGLTAIEAQVLGKPIIAADIGGVRESVIAGKTGLFFQAHSVDNLVAALKKLQSVKISPMDCKRRAEQFNFNKFAQAFKQIYA